MCSVDAQAELSYNAQVPTIPFVGCSTETTPGETDENKPGSVLLKNNEKHEMHAGACDAKLEILKVLDLLHSVIANGFTGRH